MEKLHLRRARTGVANIHARTAGHAGKKCRLAGIIRELGMSLIQWSAILIVYIGVMWWIAECDSAYQAKESCDGDCELRPDEGCGSADSEGI